MYITRHIEKAIVNEAYQKGVIAVTGARQTGKSTMMKHILQGVTHVTLDDMRDRQRAKETPDLFLRDIGTPVFIDEIQRAPELFSYIKMIVDSRKEDALYYLTGSQKFNMMKNMTESLAGRVAIYELFGFSMRELLADDFDMPFVPSFEYIEKRKPLSYNIWEHIHKGHMPEMYDKQRAWNRFYADYVKTYIERDVRQLSEVGNELTFYKFMQCLAARIGSILNLSDICKDVGNLTQPTAERWLSVLVTSNIIYLLQPYHNNSIKRAIKTPKLYFLDTGLAAYLARWDTVEALKAGAMSGRYFENFVILEILKSYYNSGIEPRNLYFYRDKDKREIDLIISQNNKLHPLEIKQHSTPTASDASAFKILESLGAHVGEGGIICQADKVYSLSDTIRAIPVGYV